MTKILVIEDEADLLEEIGDWLTFEGYDVLSAGNGVQGIQLAKEHLPDLIVCDIMMPYVDGYRVLLELRTEPATSLIPFIFMSALATRVDVRRGMNLGADDYVTKPIARREFLDAVRTRIERDIENKRRAAAALDELRTGISITLPHELRTPLVGIIGFGELLALDPSSYTPAEIQEMAKLVMASGERLLRLIDHYLLYVQLELRKEYIPTADSACEAGAVTRRAAARVAQVYAREADLTVNVIDAMAAIDADGLDKIVNEVLDNAFKFSKPGAPVKLSARIEDDAWVLYIVDHGVGISSEDIKRIGAYMQFERKRREQQGSGLGLIIAKRLLERYGGDLQIESQPGMGASVRLSVPLL